MYTHRKMSCYLDAALIAKDEWCIYVINNDAYGDKVINFPIIDDTFKNQNLVDRQILTYLKILICFELLPNLKDSLTYKFRCYGKARYVLPSCMVS